jgi:hypothetical protein
MTQWTANSTGSPLVFMRILCFADNPVKYTDPDGKKDKDVYAFQVDEYSGIDDQTPERNGYKIYFPCARFKTTAFRRSAFSLIMKG